MRKFEYETDRIAELGRDAWRRLKKTKIWNDWLMVGEALMVGRQLAMDEAKTNQPIGRRYNQIFGEWLIHYKLNDMDGSDRKRLFTVMENKHAIEAWRDAKPLRERLMLNHPNVVLRKWRTETSEPKEKESRPSPRQELEAARAHIDELETENKRLRARVAELEGRLGIER
jgi:hypothetical protein